MRRKEYAVKLGLATAGRGRMSREALDAIEKARAEGMTFDDDAPVRTPRPAAPKPSVTPKRGPVVRVDTNSPMADTVLIYPIDTPFKGEDENGKKVKVNARAVCRNSGYSIAGCACGDVHSVLSKYMTITQVSIAK